MSAETSTRHGLRKFVMPVKLQPPINPALLQHAHERRKDIQNRIADRITTFAGSMTFVYLHVICSGCGSAWAWRTTRTAC